MVYIILTTLYAYLVVKALFRKFNKNDKFLFLQDYRLNLAEILLFALIIAYIFNFYYFQETEFRDFLVSRSLLWVAFIASTMMLGIGIGIRFAIDTLHKLIPNESRELFIESKRVHDIYSQVWINVSVIFLFFIYCVMEISKPSSSFLPIYEVVLIYTLSFAFAVLYSIEHKNDHPLIKQVNLVGLGLIGLCLLSFIYELNVNFFSSLPITISFVLFIFTFLGFTLVRYLIFRFIYSGDKVMEKQVATITTQIPSIEEIPQQIELDSSEEEPIIEMPMIEQPISEPKILPAKTAFFSLKDLKV